MEKQAAPHRSRRHLGIAFVASALAALTAFAGLALAIHDGKGKKRIASVSRSDAGATHLARAIFEGNGRQFVRAKFVTTPPGNGPVAISTKSLSGFPSRGGSFAILSTGCSRYADKRNWGGATGCAGGGPKVRGARDATIWRIRVKVPRGANCLSFRFKFLSEEFPEFVGSQFNDAFIAELDHSPNWTTNGNRDPVIEAPRNFATTRDGNLISVNGTRNARVSRAAARGTTYDAATGKLRASTPVRPGSRLLYLSIFDQGDRQWDSTVFVDRLNVRKAKRCQSGVVRSK
ncbi:MAG: choice-of-anchor L domain-containing protein [Solirubrobacterales bacterium]